MRAARPCATSAPPPLWKRLPPPPPRLALLQSVRGADFIIEAVAEDEALKKEVFRKLDRVRDLGKEGNREAGGKELGEGSGLGPSPVNCVRSPQRFPHSPRLHVPARNLP